MSKQPHHPPILAGAFTGPSQSGRQSDLEQVREVLRRIAAQPEKRLILGHRQAGLDLTRIDLSRQRLVTELAAEGAALGWDFGRHGAVLARADLRGLDLREANLEEADLSGSELAGVILERANLGGVNLQHAMLEDSDLRGANLRFADLRHTILEGAQLQGADLWGANLDGALLINANLRDAVLEEASLRGAELPGADLRGSVLRKADFRGANLRGANLQGAVLAGTDLEDAALQEAKLQNLVLSNCNLAHVFACDAWLERTQLRYEQLAGMIGEERASQFELARRGYQVLERNFNGLGDADAASWAYRRRRRMQKRASLDRARQARNRWQWSDAAANYARFGADQAVEWICDYGESVGRVLASLFVVFLLFIVIYGLTGSVVRVDNSEPTPTRTTTSSLIDLAIFSLSAMTSSGALPLGMEPRSTAVHLLTGAQVLLSIALTGLLGFVVGNRIRR